MPTTEYTTAISEMEMPVERTTFFLQSRRKYF